METISVTAEVLCLLAAGLFFLTGLLTGVWKYAHIARSREAVAPVYVDIAHRSSLMYAFAAYLMHGFVPYSPVSPEATVWVVGIPLLFFALAISSYILHGILRDTDNQLRSPHRLGSGTVSGLLIHGFMCMLVIGEVGGFAILFWGFLRAL